MLTYWNCLTFLKTYGKVSKKTKPFSTKNVLDKWVFSKMNALISEVTKKLDNYDIVGAARIIGQFTIEDLSQWYVRRSRKRFQRPTNKQELNEASVTLHYILLNLSRLTAPFIPFLSENIQKNLGNKKSIHLEDWPKPNKKLRDEKLEEKMEKVREIVALGLKERVRLGIKVRQPLSELAVGKLSDGLGAELIDLIREEMNVKSIRYDVNVKDEVRLDDRITPELKEEFILRETIRQIQEMRKEGSLKPRDKISVQYFASVRLSSVLEKSRRAILKEGRIREMKSVDDPGKILGTKKEVEVDQEKLFLGIEKI